ncbi:MAG: SDR family oxidoreductase [Deltaproteobacteria bacterium]|nr:SDR family oxidoreductase [Deltaproteobacteria bacterium]
MRGGQGRNGAREHAKLLAPETFFGDLLQHLGERRQIVKTVHAEAPAPRSVDGAGEHREHRDRPDGLGRVHGVFERDAPLQPAGLRFYPQPRGGAYPFSGNPGDRLGPFRRARPDTLGEPVETFLSQSADCPLRRVAQPEDIARAVVFLASDDAAMITGSTLDVDGGRCI